MRTLYPKNVYIIEDVCSKPEAASRLKIFLEKIHTDRINIITRQQLNQIAKEQQWGIGWTKRTGAIKPQHSDPTIVFDVFTRFTSDYKDQQQLYSNIPFTLWARPFSTRNSIALAKQGIICKTAIELHCALGCIHSCKYCHIDDLLHIMLNLNETVQNLDNLIKSSKQGLWKLDSLTDTIALEPELNASKTYVEYFSQFKDKFLLLYTKSNNVDHLLNLNHRGQTIISFTISCNTQANTIERLTPSLSNRISAMKKCQEARYTIRIRFQPIVPIHNWKQENSNMVEEVLTQVQPDVIALKALAHMNATDLEKVFEPETLDLRFHNQALQHQSQSKTAGPFPDSARIEIYQFMIEQIKKHNQAIPIALCTETAQVWKAISTLTSIQMNNFKCVCGPLCIPIQRRQ